MSLEDPVRQRIARLRFLMSVRVIPAHVSPVVLPTELATGRFALAIRVLQRLVFCYGMPGATLPVSSRLREKLIHCLYKSGAHDSFSNRNLFVGKC